MGFQNVSDGLRNSFPERDINGGQCMIRTIRQTQEFGPITASNDEKVSVPVVLLLGVQVTLPGGPMCRHLVRETGEAGAFRGTAGIHERHVRQCRGECEISG